MWRINHLGNRLEVESYEGEERRGVALMGQIVANIGSRRLNPKGLREGVEMSSDHSTTGPVISHGSAALDCDPPDVWEMPLAA